MKLDTLAQLIKSAEAERDKQRSNLSWLDGQIKALIDEVAALDSNLAREIDVGLQIGDGLQLLGHYMQARATKKQELLNKARELELGRPVLLNAIQTQQVKIKQMEKLRDRIVERAREHERSMEVREAEEASTIRFNYGKA